jgi:hypothetical protein
VTFALLFPPPISGLVPDVKRQEAIGELAMVMFVKFEDAAGKEVWVNPMQVVCVRPDGSGAATIFTSVGYGNNLYHFGVKDAPGNVVVKLQAESGR